MAVLPAQIATNMKILLTLIFGIVLGFSISQLLHMSSNSYDTIEATSHMRNPNVRRPQLVESAPADDTVKSEYVEPYESQQQLTSSAMAGADLTHPPIMQPFYSSETGSAAGVNATLARYLYNETRILCWVLTGPANHQKRAVHVQRTWGARCNKLIFMSSVADEELGAVALPVGEGRGNLWQKTREALKYIYDHHMDDADWFMKADDDTYVIPENLRSFLYPYSTEAPVYFGCKFKPHVRQGYMSGGAGYVLSKEALRRFVERAYPDSKICRQRNGGSEDKELGYCLQNVDVVAGDSRDEYKRGRFFPSSPQGHIIPKDKTHWYWRYIFYATSDGLNCCSDHAISFHYIQPNFFYLLDYLIYHLRPFGILQEGDELPQKLNMSVLLEKWRNETSDNPL